MDRLQGRAEDTVRKQASAAGTRSSRSRTGCWTCRVKKVKCDEARPACQRCGRLRLLCDYRTSAEKATRQALARRANSMTSSSQPDPKAVMTVQLSEFKNSACSLDLTAADHEAIRYFRTTFARVHHTKNPDFSVFSIMFTIAEREPLVMRVLLALGGRDIETRRPHNFTQSTSQVIRRRGLSHLHHYSVALRSLANTLATDADGQDVLDLDTSCTAIYLMLLYEQKYGDADCQGLANHLSGAALILRHRCRDLCRQLRVSRKASPPVLTRHTVSGTNRLSLYAARLIIWISLCDAAAATYGVGGSFITALHEILGQSHMYDAPQWVERLHTFSNPLFRTMWTDSYPQAELLDDIENRSVFELMVCIGQTRYLLAELARADASCRQRRLEAAMETIEFMSSRYSELLEVASELSPSTSNSHRLVSNLRTMAPLYHAVVVLFMRLAGDDVSTLDDADPAAHINSIMNLARQGFRHGGDEAVMRVAWPLIVVAVETDNQQYRDWILARFQALSPLGKNLERAHDFLISYTARPRGAKNPWLDPWNSFRASDGSLFVV